MKVYVNDVYLFDGIMSNVDETDVMVDYSEYETCYAHIQPTDDIAKEIAESFSNAERITICVKGVELVFLPAENAEEVEVNIRTY